MEQLLQSRKKTYFTFRLLHFVGIILVCLVSGCIDISDTVIYEPGSESSGIEDLSTLYPVIQSVSPGTLQSVDVPDDPQSSVSADLSSVVIVFSEEMENDSDEMASSLVLYENGSQVAVTITPAASSRYFLMTLGSGTFAYGSEYTARIYKTAALNDDAELTLNFEPLVELPATTLSPVDPDYVEYAFTTAAAETADNTPPYLLASTPADGDTGVDVDLTGTTGRIELTFYDNANPMILPSTVNTSSVELYNITTPGVVVITSIDFIYSDLNYKTYHIYPTLSLDSASTYRLTLSPSGNRIADIAGNEMNTEYVYFVTQ